MIIRNLFFTSVITLGFITHGAAQTRDPLTKIIARAYDLDDSLLRIWRSDKYGCSKRRLGFVDSLFKLKQIMNMPKKIFLMLYGNPDEIPENGVLVYRNVLHCDKNNKAEKETSSLDVNVFFEDDRLIDCQQISVD